MRAARMGDPLERGDRARPAGARTTCATSCTSRWRRASRAGARLLLGGERSPGPGACYPPTVLADVRPGMPAYDEELFGPVARDRPRRGRGGGDRASPTTATFGLGAAVFTRDVARGERIAPTQLEAGRCFVNALVESDPRLPFGGIKESGYGRELGELRHPRVRQRQDGVREVKPIARRDAALLGFSLYE